MFSTVLAGALSREREENHVFESWLRRLHGVTLSKPSLAGARFLLGRQDDHTRTYIIASL